MAARRMFSRELLQSDKFLDLDPEAQLLYFHICLESDDDGFVSSPKKVARTCGISFSLINSLVQSGFLILFESGIVLVRHWLIHNQIRRDRYKPSMHLEEKRTLVLRPNKEYALISEVPEDEISGCQFVYQPETQINIDENSTEEHKKDKNSEDMEDHENSGNDDSFSHSSMKNVYSNSEVFGEFKHVLLSNDEYRSLVNDYGQKLTDKAIQIVDEYCEMKDAKYKNYLLPIKKWGIQSALKESEAEKDKESYDTEKPASKWQ